MVLRNLHRNPLQVKLHWLDDRDTKELKLPFELIFSI
jgi:hypothetical protein